MDATRTRPRFGWMELVVSIALLAILSGTLAPVVVARLAAVRDARRLSDVKTIVGAIERHLAERGALPDGDDEAGADGWDTTLDGRFVPALLAGGFLREAPRDPINDATFHYRYRRYPAGTSGFASDFYVLGIETFETPGYASRRGWWKGADRDWSAEFAWVTGGASR